jgi:hypothetical protein
MKSQDNAILVKLLPAKHSLSGCSPENIFADGTAQQYRYSDVKGLNLYAE